MYKIVLIVTIFLLLSIFISWFGLLSSKDRAVITQKYKTVQYGSLTRSYLISLPQKTTENTKLIIGLHGFGDSARKFAYYTGLHNTVSDNDIVIYPQAATPEENQKTGWNAGFCCGSGWMQGVDDAGFIHQLINDIKTTVNIPNLKTYVTGFSNGAFMAQKIAVDYPDSINGIAVSSGSIGTEDKRLYPNNAVPTLLLHGKLDKTVPFKGGFKETDPEFVWLPFGAMEQAWLKANGSTKKPVERIVYPDDGHEWHDWRIINFWHKSPQASEEITRFFNRL